MRSLATASNIDVVVDDGDHVRTLKRRQNSFLFKKKHINTNSGDKNIVENRSNRTSTRDVIQNKTKSHPECNDKPFEMKL